MATYQSNLDAKANVGGGGGVDTYTAPNEYYVDPTLGADATKRQYPTIAAALTAATVAGDNPTVIRLADGQGHSWDGTGLPSARVFFYCTQRGGAILEFDDGSVLTSDESIRIENCLIDPLGAFDVGVANLFLSNCEGFWLCRIIDPPTPGGFSQLSFKVCDFSGFGVTVDPDISTEGRLEFLNGRVESFFDPVWDQGFAVPVWDLLFEDSEVRLRSDGNFVYTVFSDDGGTLSVMMRSSTIIISTEGRSTFSGGSTSNGINWESCRIINGIEDLKSFSGFSFGTIGVQTGLVIEGPTSGIRLPNPAPDGTLATSPVQNSVGYPFGQVQFIGQTRQWRLPSNAVLFGGSEAEVGVPTRFVTAHELDPYVLFTPGFAPYPHSIKGRLIANNSEVDLAVWDIDLIVVLESSSSLFTATVLAGGIPTLVYEATPGQYSLEIQTVVQIEIDNTTVTSDLIINGTALNANAGPRTPGSDDFNGSPISAQAIIGVGFSDVLIAGDFSFVPVGAQLTITGSTGNDGTYTVNFVFFSGINTEVYFEEALPDPTVDGSLLIPEEMLIAADIAAAVNDGSNSFTALCTATSLGSIVTFYSFGSGADLVVDEDPNTPDINPYNGGVSFIVTRNSGAPFSTASLDGLVQLVEGRTFV